MLKKNYNTLVALSNTFSKIHIIPFPGLSGSQEGFIHTYKTTCIQFSREKLKMVVKSRPKTRIWKRNTSLPPPNESTFLTFHIRKYLIMLKLPRALPKLARSRPSKWRRECSGTKTYSSYAKSIKKRCFSRKSMKRKSRSF